LADGTWRSLRAIRIVAGSRKGARIFAPKGRGTRPTSDRVREAMFAMIGPVDGADVLDLFAGSGALGLEALSRGAASAVLVESDREALRTIERNVAKLGLEGARIVRADAVRFVERGRDRYDLVLVDPPYEMVESLRMSLARNLPGLLSEGGTLVVETAADEEFDIPLPRVASRRHGSTRITIYGDDEVRA
jgi:16S rRNA (guanine966-N2)-methyltransferase